jgi:ParB/RepB/Spo0J family partition protein
VEEDLTLEASFSLVDVPIENLVLDPFKLRVRYDDEKVDRLKGSILQMGLLSRLKVWLNKGEYWVVDGNYRLLALKELGWKKIPVELMPEETSHKQALLVAVINNWHREGFTFMDKARSVRRLREAGHSDLEICARLELALEKGYPGKQFHRYRSFEEYVPDDVKNVLSVTSDRIRARHAQALVMLKDMPEEQRKLAERIVTEKLTGPEAVREAEKILNPEKYLREPKPWVCDCCEQEQPPEEGKTIIKLCPQCFAEFEAWRHERGSGE